MKSPEERMRAAGGRSRKYQSKAKSSEGMASTANGKDTSNGLPRPMTLAEFLAAAKLPIFLVEPLLQHGYLYTLTALTAHGKTTVMILLALCVAIAKPFADHHTEQGRVVFFAGENPDDTAQKFVVACEFWGLDPADLPITVIPGAFDLSGNIDDALGMAEHDGPAALILIDTSAAYRFDENEDDNQLSKVWGQQLRRFTRLAGSPVVIAAAHPTKRADREALLPRGGGAFLNEVDGNLALWADLDAGRADLHWCGKLRGPSFAPIRFDMRKHPHPTWKFHDGKPVPMVVAVPTPRTIHGDHPAGRLTGDKARAYEVLANVMLDRGRLGMVGVPSNLRSVTEDEWREAFYASANPAVTQSAKRKGFTRNAKDLVNMHIVGMGGGRVWQTRPETSEEAGL
jgi:hypothetical protein